MKVTKLDVAVELKPTMKKDTEELMLSKDFVPEKKDCINSKMVMEMEELKAVKDIEDHKPLNDVESEIMMDSDELKLAKDIEEVKSKVRNFELKLNEVIFSVHRISIP